MSQVVDPPEENTEATPIFSGHQDTPKHHNEIVEEPAEEVQDQITVEAQAAQQEVVAEPVPIAEPQPLRRSTRERKTTISDDYVYMSEEGHNMGKVDDLNLFKEAMSSEHSHKWIEAMEEELKSISTIRYGT
jgi:hypothetical protein